LDASTEYRIETNAGQGNPGAGLDVAKLTAGLAKGDEEAYRIFYESYFDRLFRYLLVVTHGNEDAARDALQATLLRVVRHVRVFHEEKIFWGWLTVLARSALTDQGRKKRRYLAFLERFTLHAKVQPVAGASSDTENQLLALLETGLADLPPDERQLLESKYYDGRSVRDLAAALQTSEKALESKLLRVRRKLKDALLSHLKHE
jgi:RNA polymerase sigma-70 factor (ECF subfamily)